MTAHRFLPAFGLLALLALPSATRSEETLNYSDLIKRMTDLAWPAVLPTAGETCQQWSSFDRASQYDAATGKYLRWDANGDGEGVIRTEGDQVVMAEMQGPGCIWRIWSAAADQGHVKIFLDGQTEPAVDLPFAAYFDGQHKPFDYPALSYNLAQVGCSGQNLYLPIPYQKSCKIVADKGWGRYFHFNYVTYPAGTKLPTFGAALVAQHDAQLRTLNDYLTNGLGTDPAGKRDGEATVAKSIRVAPGETACVGKLDGPRAITALRVRAKFADREDAMAATRRLALQITWDGESKPAVWCPLGDFFGTAPGVNLYKTLWTGMTEDGFYSLHYMPFGKSALVELINEDQKPRDVEFEITHAPLDRPLDAFGHFHCKWHRDTVELPQDRRPDWLMLKTEGRGRFCGVMLHVWNPRGGWWGEGDEKFFVDGEKFPSTIGTGSEDYFGYAWGNPNLFQKPYHAQTMDQKNKGHQSVLRWHFVDNVPFQKSFEGCIEKYFDNNRGTLFALTTQWYLAPGGVDPYEPVPVEQRDGYYDKPFPVFAGIRVLNDPAGSVETQKLGNRGPHQWKNDEQLWWTGAHPKDKLVLAIPVSAAGKYEVVVQLTKAIDYGIVQLSVDSQKAGEPIDLFNDGVVPTGPITLGTFELSEGQHTLTVEIVGANPQAKPAFMFGIDRIELKPAR
jgi:hypothetical protein